MADDNDAGVVGEVTGTEGPAAAPEPKKRRGPRAQKPAAEAAVSTDASVKTPKTRKARAEKAEVKPVAVEVSSETKRARKPRTAKSAVAAPAIVGDDISDLLKLEEENKSLRKALAEKLRAENADLRKLLGQA